MNVNSIQEQNKKVVGEDEEIVNGRVELVLCWSRLRRDARSCDDGSSLGSLPIELVELVGSYVPVPLVYETFIAAEFGTTRIRGPRVVVNDSEIRVNSVRVILTSTKRSANHISTADATLSTDNRKIQWELQDNLDLLRWRNASNAPPAAAQLVFSADDSDFAGVCWIHDPVNRDLSIHTWTGRLKQPTTHFNNRGQHHEEQHDLDHRYASSLHIQSSPFETAISSLAALPLAERCDRLRDAWSSS